MAGKVVDIWEVLTPDNKGCYIANQYMDWETRRQAKVAEWTEISRYVYATDTTQTTNSQLPWSNKTTIPKLCQIRDNLFANYMASMFPKQKWLIWEGTSKDDETKAKSQAIETYIGWAMDRNEFYDEASKLVLDYIDYGNAFVTVEWVDQRNVTDDQIQVGYVGPVIRRISPLDIVFNPIAPDFKSAPKIIRSLLSKGEVKEMMERMSKGSEEEQTYLDNLWKYMDEIRSNAGALPPNTMNAKDATFDVAGFDNFQAYLNSDYVEILTFYGDIYDQNSGKFERNQIIRVVDRHKILSQETNPSFFGTAPIYNAGWRIRSDNLWSMGPLDNLVGMQYRIDHLENLKADMYDLVAAPPLKVRGYVESFDWAPMERIYVGDDGDVEMMHPEVNALQANMEIANLQAVMEEMAGSPKEAMGFRTPGEKTAYEVQRLENAAARIFDSKIKQFERTIIENALNAMLELARRNMDRADIRVWNDEANVAVFRTLTADDITGQGRIRPMAARHFAEQSEMVQNITNFFGSAVGQDPLVKAHMSTVGIAKLFEQLLQLEDFNLVEPFIRMTEESQAQQMAQVNQENNMMSTQTPSGVIPGDPSQPTPTIPSTTG